MARSRIRFGAHGRIGVGLLVGVLAGILVRIAPPSEYYLSGLLAIANAIGQIFIRFVFMMVVPLIVCALSLGVAELGDLRSLGRIGGRMLAYTLIVTSLSVALGLGMVNLAKPGNFVQPQSRAMLMERFAPEALKVEANAQVGASKTVGDVLITLVPQNPLEDMVRAFDPTYRGGGLLAVMFFALILGVAMSSGPVEQVAPFKKGLESLYHIVMKVIGYAMKLAPYGVAALIFTLVAKLGLEVMQALLAYVLLVLLALAIQQFITYSIILKWVAKVNPLWFFRQIGEVMTVAFSTSSSNATLPTAIRVSIDNLKLPKKVVNFVLTIGSTANQNGTALYEGITILFLAQTFGIELELGKQLFVLFICVLAGIGTAGVPGGSLPVMVLILEVIDVPGGAIALIFGVDRILDMSRTVLNVTGDITAAAVISRFEKPEVIEA